jgi:hypothetical protein
MASYEELQTKGLAELRELAKAAGLRGHSRLRRDELLAALSGAAAPAAVAEPVGAPAPDPVSSAPTQAPEAGPWLEERVNLPFSYGVDRIVLMVRDPQWLFTYWDISGSTWEEIQRRGLHEPGAGWRRVLRLHDVTGTTGAELGSHTLRADIEVTRDAVDWYFQSPHSDRDYVVEFGYLSASGEFFRIAVSNVIAAPRAVPSSDMDATWGRLYDEAYRLSLAGGEPGEALTSADVTRKLEELLSEGISSAHFATGPGVGRAA